MASRGEDGKQLHSFILAARADQAVTGPCGGGVLAGGKMAKIAASFAFLLHWNSGQLNWLQFSIESFVVVHDSGQ